ncbi:MAG: hypothetical protein IE934_13390 [Sphingopyxis sp.]|nr:hypothetical protein [Sphingopyxis sp.]
MKVGLDDFAERLREAMAEAATRYGAALPSPDSIVELHLQGVHDRSASEAATELFLDEDRFYKCIDVSVHPRRGPDVFFVRASGHTPCPWEETMHAASSGPFHVMTPA